MSRKETMDHLKAMLDEVDNALRSGDLEMARKLLALAKQMIERLEEAA